MKNKQQSMGIALAFALICLLGSSTFAQPATCRDTTAVADYSVVTFVLPAAEPIPGKTFMAVLRTSPIASKGFSLESREVSEVQFYAISFVNCELAEPGDPAPMLAMKNKREITDPEMKARLRQALLEQLSLYRKMILDETKR